MRANTNPSSDLARSPEMSLSHAPTQVPPALLEDVDAALELQAPVGGQCVDAATRTAPGLLLATPHQCAVLSPLTTLGLYIMRDDYGARGVYGSLQRWHAALGVPAGVDLCTFDAVAASLSDDPVVAAKGVTVLALGLQVGHRQGRSFHLVRDAYARGTPGSVNASVLRDLRPGVRGTESNRHA